MQVAITNVQVSGAMAAYVARPVADGAGQGAESRQERGRDQAAYQTDQEYRVHHRSLGRAAKSRIGK